MCLCVFDEFLTSEGTAYPGEVEADAATMMCSHSSRKCDVSKQTKVGAACGCRRTSSGDRQEASHPGIQRRRLNSVGDSQAQAGDGRILALHKGQLFRIISLMT